MREKQQQQQMEQLIERMQQLQAELVANDQIIPKAARAGRYLTKFADSLAQVVDTLKRSKAGEVIATADFDALMQCAQLSVEQGVAELGNGYRFEFPTIHERHPQLERKVADMAAMNQRLFGGDKKSKRKPVRTAMAPPSAKDYLLAGDRPRLVSAPMVRRSSMLDSLSCRLFCWHKPAPIVPATKSARLAATSAAKM
ncbi:MAG: hypothetical protein P1U63_07725 [Coxiellaceae bacterium]|nr:hypothetical protein [Coxiellaceae bacterium]